jgi:hypothetical protein
VVSMMAVGWAGAAAAGLAAAVAAGFFAGVVFAAGAVCDHPAEHAATASKQIEKQIRMEAPERRASPGRTAEGGCPQMVFDDCEVRFYPRVRKKLMIVEVFLRFCHPERSNFFALRRSCGAEGPAPSEVEGNP